MQMVRLFYYLVSFGCCAGAQEISTYRSLPRIYHMSLHFPSDHMVIRIFYRSPLPIMQHSIKDRRRRSCPNSKYRWCGDEVIKSDCGTHSLQIGYLVSTLLQIECKTFPMQYIYYQRFGDMGSYTNHMNWSRGRGVSKNFTLVYNPYGVKQSKMVCV